MPKTKKDKTYSYKHTTERALQRHGIILTPAIYEDWYRLCNAGNLIQKDSTFQSVHCIQWNGLEFNVVVKHCDYESYISTILPTKGLLRYGKKIKK